MRVRARPTAPVNTHIFKLKNGKMGRNKLPQQVLVKRGTARKDRKRTMPVSGELITTLEQVEALCDYSKLTEQGKRIFIQRCTYFMGLKMLEATYLDTLLLYAQYFDMALQCMEAINAGEWYSAQYDKKGGLVGYVENPHLKQFDKLCRALGALSKELLMTPASRMRMAVEGENKIAGVMDITADPIEVEV